MEPRSTKLIKSPLRYPGGKQRLARTLVYMLPQDIKEYREPFVGGGHVFVLLRQARPDVKVFGSTTITPTSSLFGDRRKKTVKR